MNKKIIVAAFLAVFAAILGVTSGRINQSTLILLPLGLLGASLVFFSRGILIFLTILCLSSAGIPFFGIWKAALQLRWVLLGIFCFHTFGDIFLGRAVRRIKLFDCLALVFISYAFMSISYSPYPRLSLERSTTILLLYISVFWIIWKYAYHQGPEKVVSLILGVIWIIFIASYAAIFIGPYRPFLNGRFMGVFANPNGMGVVSALILPLSLWKFLETGKKSALFLFLLISLSLLLCGARGSINAALFSLGYFIYARSKKNNPFAFFATVSGVLIFIWIIETLAKEFFKTYIRVESIPILGGRLEAWQAAVSLIMDKPLFGYGFGVEDKLFGLKKVMFHAHSGAYAHNSFLGMLLQLGLLGFTMFFVPLFVLLFKELFPPQEDREIPILRYALRASLIAGLICCMSESWIYSVGNTQVFPFWIMVMLLMFYRHSDKEKVEASGA